MWRNNKKLINNKPYTKIMIKFLLQASSAMLFTLASLTTVIAQDCITFEFPNETGEATFLSDEDMCGTNVTWEEPAIIDTCDEETEVTIVTNFEQGQYFDVGYHELVYQAFDENEVLLGQSEFYLDVFDNLVPVPQGEDITQENPIDFPQYFDGPDVNLEGDYDVALLPNYTALDNCAGEVVGVPEVEELDADTRVVTYIFSDGTQASELEILVYSNVVVDSVGESILSDAQGDIGMSIFPNPIADKATVKLDSQFSNNYEVTVYSMTGKVVYTDVFVNGENQLDAEFLASGMYTIHVTSGASSKIERFIKK